MRLLCGTFFRITSAGDLAKALCIVAVPLPQCFPVLVLNVVALRAQNVPCIFVSF